MQQGSFVKILFRISWGFPQTSSYSRNTWIKCCGT